MSFIANPNPNPYKRMNSYEQEHLDPHHGFAGVVVRCDARCPREHWWYMPKCTSTDPNNHQGDTCPIHER
jgi:hypothetical protein